MLTMQQNYYSSVCGEPVVGAPHHHTHVHTHTPSHQHVHITSPANQPAGITGPTSVTLASASLSASSSLSPSSLSEDHHNHSQTANGKLSSDLNSSLLSSPIRGKSGFQVAETSRVSTSPPASVAFEEGLGERDGGTSSSGDTISQTGLSLVRPSRSLRVGRASSRGAAEEGDEVEEGEEDGEDEDDEEEEDDEEDEEEAVRRRRPNSSGFPVSGLDLPASDTIGFPSFLLASSPGNRCHAKQFDYLLAANAAAAAALVNQLGGAGGPSVGTAACSTGGPFGLGPPFEAAIPDGSAVYFAHSSAQPTLLPPPLQPPHHHQHQHQQPSMPLHSLSPSGQHLLPTLVYAQPQFTMTEPSPTGCHISCLASRDESERRPSAGDEGAEVGKSGKKCKPDTPSSTGPGYAGSGRSFCENTFLDHLPITGYNMEMSGSLPVKSGPILLAAPEISLLGQSASNSSSAYSSIGTRNDCSATSTVRPQLDATSLLPLQHASVSASPAQPAPLLSAPAYSTFFPGPSQLHSVPKSVLAASITAACGIDVAGHEAFDPSPGDPVDLQRMPAYLLTSFSAEATEEAKPTRSATGTGSRGGSYAQDRSSEGPAPPGQCGPRSEGKSKTEVYSIAGGTEDKEETKSIRAYFSLPVRSGEPEAAEVSGRSDSPDTSEDEGLEEDEKSEGGYSSPLIPAGNNVVLYPWMNPKLTGRFTFSCIAFC